MRRMVPNRPEQVTTIKCGNRLWVHLYRIQEPHKRIKDQILDLLSRCRKSGLASSRASFHSTTPNTPCPRISLIWLHHGASNVAGRSFDSSGS